MTPSTQDKLEPYRAKRDFSLTAEPSGAATDPPEPGSRFVVQRHRARRLHYDLRLEVDGVLVSWAVPKGPTLDPKARHLAVHVEDHPLDYFDFEGVIPEGEYGGGDVIVWDWGTWSLARAEDPHRALTEGDLHFDLQGVKLAGRFVLVRSDRGRRRAGKDEWLLLKKADDAAVPGWDPEDHPASVKSGRTNDEVRDAPSATWWPKGADPGWSGPTDDEREELASLPERGGTWHFQGFEIKLTNLDRVLFPARGRSRPVVKRELVRHHAEMAPHLLPYLSGRPLNLHRYPQGADRKGFWQKEVPAGAPEWVDRWRNEEADPGETEWYVVAEKPATLVWLANQAAFELHPWTSTADAPHQPSWALVDLDPGPATSFDDLLVLARLHRTALEHLGVDGMPKVSGRRGIQIWIPVAPGATFDHTRAWVEKLSRAVGATVPELVSWKWEKQEREGLARLDYTQNAINKTLVAPFSARPAAGAPVSVPIRWDELDDPGLRPDRWTIRTIADRVAEAGDPLRPLIGRPQLLPDL
jgi:bifunctional non-homologous end joining protein LigD